jgi:hypothetical protein
VTNGLAVFLALLIGGLIAADALLNGWAATLFAARRFMDLLAWATFWR